MRRREFLTKTGLGLAAASATAATFGTAHGGTPAAGASAPASSVAPPAAPAPSGAKVAPACPAPSPAYIGPLPLVRAQPDRIIAITVCTRPFRAQGPRIEAERLGRKTIVHNYGHGGTGWSLSWGSSTLALRHVLATREREIAVIGCGALGLTSALLAQRAGLKVRIYAKERPPDVRSTFATGNWSPNSRFCTQESATPEVAARWEEMARISFRSYQFMLGLPGDPIEWRDGYSVPDDREEAGSAPEQASEPEYPDLERRIRDLGPRRQILEEGTHPFPTPVVARYSNLIFNISAYTHLLISDFLAAGGIIETREFEKPGDIAKLREKTVVNCTGYGARALFGDESVTPVRGQIVRLIPQPEVTYGLTYRDLYMLPRRDALILQTQAAGDFGSADITPDRAAAERTVQTLADLNVRIAANQACMGARR
ncbi:MAG: FAD-dependent oxidoreductase [Gammaproteobacteria bacterium]